MIIMMLIPKNKNKVANMYIFLIKHEIKYINESNADVMEISQLLNFGDACYN